MPHTSIGAAVRLVRTTALVFALLMAPEAAAHSHRHRAHRSRRSFDYYLLAMSWSPTFCATAGARGGDECQSSRHAGFVVHGLWPQDDTGGYPRWCSGSREVPRDLVRELLPIMPSEGLITHEWQAHGRCSHLGAKRYFDAVRKAFARVRVPSRLRSPRSSIRTTVRAFESMFLRENPELSASSIVIKCKGRRLSEVQICLDRHLDYRACGQGVHDNCRGAIIIPAAR